MILTFSIVLMFLCILIQSFKTTLTKTLYALFASPSSVQNFIYLNIMLNECVYNSFILFEDELGTFALV